MVDGVSTVWVPVADLDRARSFYRDTLGLSETKAEDGWAELDTGGLVIGLNSREEGGAGVEGGPVIAFSPTGDLEGAVEGLKDKGVDFPGEISEHPWGRIATFKDSEGNDLQLYEPPQ